MKNQFRIKTNQIQKYYLFDKILIYKITSILQFSTNNVIKQEGKRHYLFGIIPIWGTLDFGKKHF